MTEYLNPDYGLTQAHLLRLRAVVAAECPNTYDVVCHKGLIVVTPRNRRAPGFCFVIPDGFPTTLAVINPGPGGDRKFEFPDFEAALESMRWVAFEVGMALAGVDRLEDGSLAQ